MKYTFTFEEQQFIKDYAERFFKHKGKASSDKYKRSSSSGLAIDIKGYSGELAVHKFFMVKMPDFNPEYTKKDMLLGFNGTEIVCDIKTSIYSKPDGWGGRYKVMGMANNVYDANKENKKIDAFIAVDMKRDNTEAEILGIILWEDFVKHHERIAVGQKGDIIPCVNIKHLEEMGDYFEYISS